MFHRNTEFTLTAKTKSIAKYRSSNEACDLHVIDAFSEYMHLLTEMENYPKFRVHENIILVD